MRRKKAKPGGSQTIYVIFSFTIYPAPQEQDKDEDCYEIRHPGNQYDWQYCEQDYED